MHWLLAASPALAASPTLLAASPTLLAASPTLLRRVGGRAAPINALLAQGSRIVEVQSGARRTWSYQRPAEQVQVVLSNEGRQLDTDIELWQGAREQGIAGACAAAAGRRLTARTSPPEVYHRAIRAH